MNVLQIQNAVILSIEIGICCVVFGFPIALFLGWLLARKTFRLKSLLMAVIFSPIVLPPVVTGYCLLNLFGRNSGIGRYFAAIGVPLSFSFIAAVIAAFTVSLPFYIIIVRNIFEAIDPKLEEVSLTLGVSRLRTFLKVSVPLAFPGIAAGTILVFARSLGEFGATMILAGNVEGKTQTISLAIYSLLENPEGDPALRILTLCSLAIAFASILAYEILIRKHRQKISKTYS